MEALNPSLELLFYLIIGIKNGDSLVSLLDDLKRFDTEVAAEFQRWWWTHQNKGTTQVQFSTDHRLILSEILLTGLQGASVLQHLEGLYAELQHIHEEKTQHHLDQLPFRLMLPLVLFFFPAILILLFGPLLGEIYLEVLT